MLVGQSGVRPSTMQTHTERLAETPRRLQIGTSWSTLCRGVRDAAGEEEEVGEERRGSVYVREGERGAVWFSLNPVDPARRDTAWTETCQRRRMQARHSEEILFLLQQHSMPPRWKCRSRRRRRQQEWLQQRLRVCSAPCGAPGLEAW